MKTRQPYSLMNVVAVHNMILCVWSLVMFLGISYELAIIFMNNGVYGMYCIPPTQPLVGRVQYWMYVYYLSKYWELFDTLIIVLRKKPLIFLHLYHHTIVLLIVWLWLSYDFLYGSLGMVFNTFVHVFMYYYYYASILGKNVWWKKYITKGQIIQFISSFILSGPYIYYTVHFDKEGKFEPQCGAWNTWIFSAVCNFSFLLLFTNFYTTSYQGSSDRRSTNGEVSPLKNKKIL